MRDLFVIFISLIICFAGYSQSDNKANLSKEELLRIQLEETRLAAIEYINKYKYVAISEMLINGIPASIKLAQGLLETDNGRSVLVKNTNNHFGIKCHKGWNGKTYKYDDDSPQECFRIYETPFDSYRDHSVFLRTRPWYSFLFSINRYDYKAWSNGLKKAGYATNPQYAIGLIRRIEEFKLYEYDHYSSLPSDPNDLFATEEKIVEENNSIENIISENKILAEEKKPCPCENKIDYFNEYVVGNTTRKACLNNDVKYTLARKGDSYYRIAKDFKIELHDLYV